MTRLGRRVVTLTSALALAVAPLGIPASSATTQAPVSAYLAAHLEAGTADLLPVFVHADDVATAKRAVSASGLVLVSTWDRIGVAVARGTAAQVENVRTRPGVTYVEGDQPIEFTLATSTVATRGEEARATLVDGAGRPLDGRGISVAVIDSGIDGKHPFFRVPGAHSAVRANLKGVCVVTTARERINDRCFVDVTNLGNDTDTLSAGGHGTHVAGIVAGRDVTLTNGRQLQGSAPGAMLIGLSVGQALSIYGADSALNWVLEHHADPCGSRLNLTLCPPIKVTNNSYGPVGGGQFNENSATVKLQRALAAEDVLTVWAAGNDGGDGSESLTNPPGQDPTGGVISVASYFDQNIGTRDGVVSGYSSRGQNGAQSTYPDLSAPGEEIESSCRPYLVICSSGLMPANGPGRNDIGTFNTISGTSMAAPHIAGIVAILLQADPTATPGAVEDALVQTAYQYADGAAYEPDTARGGKTSFDKGHGLVDVVAAVGRLRAT